MLFFLLKFKIQHHQPFINLNRINRVNSNHFFSWSFDLIFHWTKTPSPLKKKIKLFYFNTSSSCPIILPGFTCLWLWIFLLTEKRNNRMTIIAHPLTSIRKRKKKNVKRSQWLDVLQIAFRRSKIN